MALTRADEYLEQHFMAVVRRNSLATLIVLALFGALIPFVAPVGVAGGAARSGSASGAPAGGGSVLLVAGTDSPPPPDRVVRDALVAVGFDVRVVDDDAVTGADAAAADVVFVSSSVRPATVGSMFASMSTPVVNAEPFLHDVLGLTAGRRADRGESSSQRAVEIVAPSHPIAGGRSGSTLVTDTATALSFGQPSAAATVIAHAPGSSQQAVLFAYETGASMVRGVAPARRVGVFPSYATGRYLTADGTALLVRAVEWAAGAAGGTSTTTGTGTSTSSTTGTSTGDAGSTSSGSTSTTSGDGSTSTGSTTGGGSSTSTGTVLLVAGTAGPPPPDRAIRDALRAAGFTVRVVDDDVARASDANGVAAVFVSTSVSPSKVGSKFATVSVPVVSSESYLHDDFGFTANSAANRSDTGSYRSLDVVDPQHPIAGGRGGTVTVAGTSTAFAFGRPAPSASVVALLPGSGDRAGVFTYEAGAAMARGTAPARRVGLFLSYQTGNQLDATGRQLVVRAVQWAAGDAGGGGTTTGGGATSGSTGSTTVTSTTTSGATTGSATTGSATTGGTTTGGAEPPVGADGLVAHYDFVGGSGSVVADDSGLSPSLDLRLAGGARLGPDGLVLTGSGGAATAGPATRLTDAMQAAGAVTFAVWATPASARPSGPGVVVGLASSAAQRSMVLSQGYWNSGPTDRFEGMLRAGGKNIRSLGPRGAVAPAPTHLVLRRTTNGALSLWVDGVRVVQRTGPTSIADWSDAFPLVVGADANGSRGFEGTIHEVAVYARGLGDDEIRQRHAAGPGVDVDADLEGPTIDVWYGDDQTFGANGVPQRWVNVLGRVTDPDGVASASFRLNGRVAQPLSLGPDDRRLLGRGDINVELHSSQLRVGANTVVITATDRGGNVSSQTVTVRWRPTAAPAMPLTVDWGANGDLTDLVQVVDGHWQHLRSASRVRTVSADAGYDRLLAIGDTDWVGYDVRTTATIHDVHQQIGPYSAANGFGFVVHWNGHNDSVASGSQPHQGFRPDSTGDPTPLGALAWWRAGEVRIQNHRVKIAGTSSPFSVVEGRTYALRLRVTKSGDRVRTQLKIWPAGQREPAGWQADYNSLGSFDEPGSGSLVLVAHEIDVSFGDVEISAP